MPASNTAPRADAAPSASPEVLYDATTDRRLADILSPCFALIVHLRSQTEFGDPAALRQRIKDLLDRAERDAQRTGIPDEHVETALFAVVAFLDETLLSSTWDQKDRWVSRPLQMERYGRFDAGEAFFDRLETLLEHPTQHAEAIEVYYLCMTLGFRGRYQVVQQEKLQEYIERCHDELDGTPGINVDTLAPNGVPSDQVAAEVRTMIPNWALALATVGLALLLYLGLSLYVSHSAQSTADQIESVTRSTTGLK
jgi:type VI secretion system protein ImpK